MQNPANTDDAPPGEVAPVLLPPRLCLCMIVKNEIGVLPRSLPTIAPHIDYWVISDTGSTDGTQRVIREYFERRGVPGELHECAWRNFGHNRTEAFERARQAQRARSADLPWYHPLQPGDVR